MYCNLRSPVWSHSTYPLPYYSDFAANTLLTLCTWPLTPWPGPLTFDLEHLQRIACHVMKLCAKFDRNRAIGGGVIAVPVFDLMTLNIALRVALGSGIFTKFDFQKLICVWIITFFDADTLSRAVTLTFDPLTLKVRGTSIITWSKSVRNYSEIEQSQAELEIIWRIFAHIMSSVTLTFDLLTLNSYSTSGNMRLNSVLNFSEI